MNRLLELQNCSGGGGDSNRSGFSPQGGDNIFERPSAASAASAYSSSSSPQDELMSTAAGTFGRHSHNRDGDEKETKLSDDDDNDEEEKRNREETENEDNDFDDRRREDAYVVHYDESLDKSIKIIEDIQDGNRQIQALTIRIRQQSAENMKNFNPAGETEEGAELIENLMDQVSSISKEVKKSLDQLTEETKALTEDEEMKADHAATVKIQQNQHAHLTRSFVQYINEYNAAVSDNERQLKEQAVRRIRLKYTKSDGSTVSDDEAREMAAQVLEYGNTSVLFQASKEVLNSVLETRADILRIERSMRELKQIMDDLSSLISEQGEIMDVVLSNVENSVKYVQSGREQLKKAKEHAESASSKMKYLCVCVSVLFLIVLAITLGATVPT